MKNLLGITSAKAFIEHVVVYELHLFRVEKL